MEGEDLLVTIKEGQVRADPCSRPESTGDETLD